jgi:diaminohydroxyphosphoribosylaminopyrimidine deaminase/5-amino-6-(5-phosphoribosylamino)uracil reductase
MNMPDRIQDQRYMARAIELARRGWYTCMPNPRVGCVIVSYVDHCADANEAASGTCGRIIGEGWHVRAGEGHAEVNALADARKRAPGEIKGATAYVTLEPCSHYGRTPPCSEGLIEAGIGRVVYAMQDPNPQVSGRGLAMLAAAGIELDGPLAESEARQLNPGFIKRMETGLPLVRAKSAMSVDGRTAMASGESQWITGPAARAEVQRLRALSAAIVSGVDSVLMDDSSLTVRATELALAALPEDVNANELAQRQPLRVVLDSWLRLPVDAAILRQPGRTVVMTISSDPITRTELEDAGAEVVVLSAENGHVSPRAVLRWLADQQCNEILLETGATLAGAWLQARLVDELKIFMAPVLMGNQARGLYDLPYKKMAQKTPLTVTDIRAVGDDWLITATPVYGD